MSDELTVKSLINADEKKVWEFYTQPAHIVGWNFADPSWSCPSATNDMRIGGKLSARMEARDGSVGFDFVGTYIKVNEGKDFTFSLDDGRMVSASFRPVNEQTEISVVFNPESSNSHEMQQNGWQAILDNFKRYTESH